MRCVCPVRAHVAGTLRVPRRPGFTLVELLTVIAIIGILASLLLVAVNLLSGKGFDVKATADLRQMSSALDTFKAKFGNYPPSRITLSADPSKMDPLSLAFVMSVWGRIDFTNPASPIDWAGAVGVIPGVSYATLRNIQYVLEGDQCLVFFLGGIPDQLAPGCRGFSSNPKNPTDVGAGAKESFYQFESGRLIARPSPVILATQGKIKFYSYQDAYATGIPYVYFSSGKTKDGYNPAPGDNPTFMPLGPYFEAGSGVGANPRRYLNGTRFQIISAGKDGLFGPGGPWSPASAASTPRPGQDDMSNFYDAKLGVPQ